MLTMGKIFVDHKIESPTEGLVKPGDKIKGKVYIRSEEKKDKKLKEVEIRMFETFEDKRMVTNADGEQEEQEFERKQKLKEWTVHKDKKAKIEAGETKEFDFEIELPEFDRKYKNGKKKKKWFVTLEIFQKTGLMGTQGDEPEKATIYPPIHKSKKKSSFGDWDPKKYKEEKKAKKAAEKAAAGQ